MKKKHFEQAEPVPMYRTHHKESSTTTTNSSSSSSSHKYIPTDKDILKQHYKFLPEEGVGESGNEDWKNRMTQNYQDHLYREFCLGDLSRYKEGKIALRWRTENEVVQGLGERTCGNLKCHLALAKVKLFTWEVNFGYTENSTKKNALVKIRLCEDCSYMLNYKTQMKEVLDGDDDDKDGI